MEKYAGPICASLTPCACKTPRPCDASQYSIASRSPGAKFMICVSSVCSAPPLPSDGCARFAQAMRPGIGPKRAALSVASSSGEGDGKGGGCIDCALARAPIVNAKIAEAMRVERFIGA